jgi:hypothetical protein
MVKKPLDLHKAYRSSPSEHKLPSRHLLKRGQVLLYNPDFDPAIMRGIDMQRHVLRIDNAQACTLDKRPAWPRSRFSARQSSIPPIDTI